jgi:hypothetical protein
MLHELQRTEEVRRMIRATSWVSGASGIESMRGWSWDEDEPAVCVKVGRKCYPIVVDCIQSGHIFYPVTVALLQITSRTADASGVSGVLAGRMLYRP